MGEIQQMSAILDIPLTTMFIIVLLMVVCGAAGGLTNFLLLELNSDGDLKNDIKEPTVGKIGYMFVGIVAVFIVPLFLSLVDSNLMSEIVSSGQIIIGKAFIFYGFCLVAAISSRAFIQTVSDRVLALAKQASQVAKETKQQQQSLTSEVDEIASNIGEQQPELSQFSDIEKKAAVEQQVGKSELSYDERRVLEAMVSKPYLNRTVSGIAIDADMDDRSMVKSVLGRLVEKQLVIEIKSKRSNNLLYKLTARGAHVIESTLENRK
jgi:hypothetical protein